MGIGNSNFWTEEEVDYLRGNYKSYNLQEISEYLGRDKTSVCGKAKSLGIERNHRKSENPSAYIKKTSEEIHAIRSESAKKNTYRTPKGFWNGKEHPRGMLGKSHSDGFKSEASKRSKEFWSNITDEKLDQRRLKQRFTKINNGTLNPMKNQSNPYSRTKSGKRPDLNNTYFRSSWEANIARYFNFVGIKWEYEPKAFVFDTIRRGSVSYTPDFYLPDEDRWVEVKGWMDQKSITKLKRFQKYYPDEFAKLEIIGAEEYKAYQKYARLIPGWE